MPFLSNSSSFLKIFSFSLKVSCGVIVGTRGAVDGVTGISLNVLNPSAVSIFGVVVALFKGLMLLLFFSFIFNVILGNGVSKILLVTSVKLGLFTFGFSFKLILSSSFRSLRLMSAFGDDILFLF